MVVRRLHLFRVDQPNHLEGIHILTQVEGGLHQQLLRQDRRLELRMITTVIQIGAVQG